MGGTSVHSAGVSFTSMRILGSYALVYLTAGRGHYQLHGQPPQPCKAGDMLVVFPEIAHGYGPPRGGEWSEVYVVFNGPVFDVWRRVGLLSPDHPILRPLPYAFHIQRLRRIVRMTSRTTDPAKQMKAVCSLQEFLAETLSSDQRKSPHSPLSVRPLWLDTAIGQMEKDPTLPLEDVARSSGMSYESFRKKFRQHTGGAPAAFRARQLFLLAQKLLYEERLTIKELADKLGFCDEFHFSKRFRQITGQTPGAFRRSLPSHDNDQL